MKNFHKIYNLKIKLLLAGFLCLPAIAILAQNLNAPNKSGPMGLQVNTKTGNLFFKRNDVLIPSRGFALTISFAYNSFNSNQSGPFGNGWSLGYNIQFLNDASNNKTIVWGDGRADTYTNIGGSYISPTGFFTHLVEYEPGKLQLTEKDGKKFYFQNGNHRRITRVEEPNGNSLIFSYSDTLLASVQTNAGQTLNFTYNINGRLSSLTDANANPTRTWTYQYDNAGNLIKVTDPLNGEYRYSYLLSGLLKEIRDRNANVVNIIYYSDYTVSELIGCNERISFAYDALTLATVVTEHMENGEDQVTKYLFKKINGLIWLTGIEGNCCGFKMNFEYDKAGNKIKETDANGNITRYTYDDNGNVLTITDALNQVYRLTYTPDFNYISSITDPKGFASEMTYDNRGNLLKIKVPGNRIYLATYAANGDIVTSTDPKGNVYIYTYDAYGNPATVTGPNGYSATLSFNSRGHLQSYTNSNGNQTAIEYDILSRLKKITDPLNLGISLQYDANGNATQIINPDNEAFKMGYDASDRPTILTDPINQTNIVQYDAQGNLTMMRNVLGQTIKSTYDKQNRLKTATNAMGETLTIDYDNKGNPTQLNLPNGHQLQYMYDALDRATRIGDEHGTIAEVTYDENNNVTSIKNGTGAITSATYDSLNRMKQITDPFGNSTTVTYDANSRIITLMDRIGNSIHFTYDNRNRVATSSDNLGATIAFNYDNESNITSLTDQNGNATNYQYDALNRMTKLTYPDGKFIEYTYNNNNHLTQVKLTDGNIIQFNYDVLNRMVEKTLPDGQVCTYTYDGLGRIHTATNNTGTTTFAYDKLNRVISESFNGRTVTYAYNNIGRTSTTTYPDGTLVHMEYDTRNRLQRVLENGVELVNYSYNNQNQLTERNFANGVNTQYQYDVASRLTGYSSGNGFIQQAQINYDKMGNKTSILRPNQPARSEYFTYDKNYRLTQYQRGPEGSPNLQQTYSYDALGNRLSANSAGTNTTYIVNNLNQLTQKTTGGSTTNLLYDNNGNLKFDGKFYKIYNAEKKLLKDSSSPAEVYIYQYDVFGRRVAKTANGQTLNYTFSGMVPIEERTGATIRSKQIFTGSLSPLTIEYNNDRNYYVQNELGSVEAITNTNGRVIERYEYDPYGKQNRLDSMGNPLNASLVGNRFGFTGQVYDSATESNSFPFRNYTPELGTFQQRDLIGYGDGMGLYQYVGNNPANGIDPLGLLGTKDPCAHDPNKVRFISNDMIQEELKTMRRHAKVTAIEYEQVKWYNFPATLTIDLFIYGKSNYESGLNADSRFYETLGSETHGGHEYFFDGQVQNSWVVNYYFTAHSLAAMQTNQVFGEGMAFGWDVGKGAFNAASAYAANTLSQKSAGLEALKAFYDRVKENPDKMGNTNKGFNDFKAFEKGNQVSRNPSIPKEFEYKRDKFGDWWPMINPKTGELGYEFFPKLDMTRTEMKEFEEWSKNNCPQNSQGGGTQRPSPYPSNPLTGKVIILGAYDPNEIIGPSGKPDKRWVSVNDRLPYTINFENDTIATAPAKSVRITAPIHSKMDASTLELSSFGFNNLSFSIPPGVSSYYQRLDCRDSLNLFVDITSGFDVVNNQIFWLMQSIDPVTLQAPIEPLKGLLLLQDSANPTHGHGFANFSIKPKKSALTLDSILAEAVIVFDENEAIGTNIERNTIDAFAPTSKVNGLPAASANSIYLTWSGQDDPGGVGLESYDMYLSTDGGSYTLFRSGMHRTDTTITVPDIGNYCFFTLARDSVGNTEALRPADVACTFVGSPLPVTWLYFTGVNQGNDNLLRWATGTETNVKQFILERSINATTFDAIATLKPNGGVATQGQYQHTDMRVDKMKINTLYYRVKQVDIDNKFNYSSVVKINLKTSLITRSAVYPNPTKGRLTLAIGTNALLESNAIIYDNNGRAVQQVKIVSGSQAINLERLSKGIYYIRLINGEILKVLKE